jgi:hypothetical protein
VLNSYDWYSAGCTVVSFIAVAVPLIIFSPPKYPEDEFTRDGVVNQAGGIGTEAMQAFKKFNKDAYDSYRWQRIFMLIGLAFLVLSVTFQLAGSALG